MKRLNERIKEIRKALGLSQETFGEKLGVTRGAITNIELNKTEPKPLFIDLICRVFNVNKNWILSGLGEMFVEVSREDKIRDFVNKVISEDDAFKKRFIEMLADLDTDEWLILQKVAEKLASPLKENVEEEEDIDLGVSAVIKPYDGPKKEIVNRILREDVEEEYERLNTELTLRGYLGNENDEEKSTKKGRNQ
ncbi:helix-turn-helix domain-containing protein [Emergencia timonensis]|uniref:helix-turn-helix domain-containing protein n=1 Tax=Emergencia timonensis TaxID=1776384 RepID=UPI0039F4E43B